MKPAAPVTTTLDVAMVLFVMNAQPFPWASQSRLTGGGVGVGKKQVVVQDSGLGDAEGSGVA